MTASAQQPTLATYQLGTGWATFGLVLPQGAAMGAVRVGSLSTQTDVKTTWPDGSIRFAVVTARVSSAGSYAITAATLPGGAITPAAPSASVSLTISGQNWVAALPAATSDVWLAGPLVREWRALVTPVAGGVRHPFLRVLYDVRSYADGTHRVDVSVQNTLNIAEANRAVYDVHVVVNGASVFRRNAVNHAYLTRWRRAFAVGGLQQAAVVPDFEPFFNAKAIPRYLGTIEHVNQVVTDTAGDSLDITYVGQLNPYMPDVGGREEIGPYPAWIARYVVHRTKEQFDWMIRHSELAGTWSVHITEPDGLSLISIDKYPDFWLDPRGIVKPLNNFAGVGYPDRSYNYGIAELAHHHSPSYVPYLVTGDRFHHDEMRFWANWVLLSAYQDGYNWRGGGTYRVGNGSMGILFGEQTRGIGWGLRTLADAAAYLADADPYRAYFREKVRNNLEYLDNYARSWHPAGPIEAVFEEKAPESHPSAGGSSVFMRPWESIYVLWGVDRALQQTDDAAGTAIRDRIVRFNLRLFTSASAGYDPAYGWPYIVAVGPKPLGSGYYQTMREVFAASFGDPPTSAPPNPVGYYGPEARIALSIAQRLGLPGAAEGLQLLASYRGPQGQTMEADLNKRSQWGLDFGAGSTSGTGPPPPPNVRIVY